MWKLLFSEQQIMAESFKAFMEWWKQMSQNSKANEKPVYAALQSFPCKEFSDDQRGYHYKPFVFIYLRNLFL